MNYTETKIQGLQDGLENAGAKLERGVETGKDKLANAMASGSDRILEGAEKIESQAVYAAEKLTDGADYLRTATRESFARDCRLMLRKHPVPAFGIALVAGLLLGRALWSTRHA